MVSICPYSVIHKEEVRIFDSEHFMLPFLFFFKEKVLNHGIHWKSQNSALSHSQKYQCKGIKVAITKSFGLCFKHIKVNVQNLIFCISLNVVWLFYITCNSFIFIKTLFLHYNLLHSFKINNIILFISIFRAVWNVNH